MMMKDFGRRILRSYTINSQLFKLPRIDRFAIVQICLELIDSQFVIQSFVFMKEDRK